MATSRKRKASAKSGSPITLILQDIRLKKFSLDILLPVEDAGKGTVTWEYTATVVTSTEPNTYATILQAIGNGTKKDGPDSIIAFTIQAEMIGVFTLSDNPTDKDLEEIFGPAMANHIAPVLADTIEVAMFKTGYPRLNVPKTVPKTVSNND